MTILKHHDHESNTYRFAAKDSASAFEQASLKQTRPPQICEIYQKSLLLDPFSSYKLKGLIVSSHRLNLSSSNCFCLGCCNSPNLQPAFPPSSFQQCHPSLNTEVRVCHRTQGAERLLLSPGRDWTQAFLLLQGDGYSSRYTQHCTLSPVSVPDHRAMDWIGWEGILKAM